MPDTPTQPVTIQLTPEQVALVRTALRLLLSSEDDVAEIREIKTLLARLSEHLAAG